MKLRKKALLPAIAMVLASVIALSGVTYAWFTTSNTATVGAMDVNVAAANGIQVSLDGVAWKSNIYATDLKEAAAKGLSNYSGAAVQYPSGTDKDGNLIEILPVSTAGDVDANGKMKMYLGAYDTDGTLDSVREEEVTRTIGNFVAFDLFIKSSSEQYLSLDFGNGGTYAQCTDSTSKTDAAVRVAFLPMGSAASGTAAQGLKTIDADAGKLMIWEPNASLRADGVTSETNEPTTMGFYTAFENIAESALGADQVKAVTTYKTSGDFQNFILLQNGVNKIRIYIWLEGQDIDCVNAISSGDFIVNLKFSVPDAE